MVVFDRNARYSFGKVSKAYERFREDYPKTLLDELSRFAGLRRGSRVLEIGCGTGKATLPFARLGCSMTCMDVNGELIEEAAKKTSGLANVRYVNAPFEESKLPLGSFDLVFAAQAWHWIDPQVGYAKVARLLRRGGPFAVFWKMQNLNGADALYSRYCPKYPGDIHERTEAEMIGRIKKMRSFGVLTKETYTARKRFSKDEYLGLAGTYSWVADLDVGRRRALFRELSKAFDRGGGAVLSYQYTLLMCRKTDTLANTAARKQKWTESYGRGKRYP